MNPENEGSKKEFEHPLLSRLPGARAKKGKVVSPEEAVRVIRDGDTVATGTTASPARSRSWACSGRVSPASERSWMVRTIVRSHSTEASTSTTPYSRSTQGCWMMRISGKASVGITSQGMSCRDQCAASSQVARMAGSRRRNVMWGLSGAGWRCSIPIRRQPHAST